jgi:heme-degrading monooxygenase HmoA
VIRTAVGARACAVGVRTCQTAGVVLEVAVIEVLPGQEDAFVAAYHRVRPEITGAPGCRSVRMTRGVESPSRFVLLVEWETVEAHERGFRGTERFGRWRAAIGPHFAAPPRVEHYADVAGPRRDAEGAAPAR